MNEMRLDRGRWFVRRSQVIIDGRLALPIQLLLHHCTPPIDQSLVADQSWLLQPPLD